jgi:uncharacterized protein YdcH (DUF465 family)
MSNTPHTLHDEFPAEAQKISALKVKDTHFAKLLVDYDQVNDKVHRAETRLDLLSEAEEEDRHRPAQRLTRDFVRQDIAGVRVDPQAAFQRRN